MLEILINAVTLGSLYLLFALGMSVAWGTIGILNFAHGSTFMFSAMVAYFVVQTVTLPMWAMVLLGAAVGTVLSVLTQALVFNLILRRNPDLLKAEMQIVVGGIGTASVLLAIAQHYTKSVPFGFSASTFKVATYQLGPVHISNVQLVILVAALGLAGLAEGVSFAIPGWQPLLALLVLAGAGHCLSWALISRAMAHLGVAMVGLLLLLQPIVAFLLDVLLLDRATSGREWWGLAFSLAGIFLASLKGRSRLPEQPV